MAKSIPRIYWDTCAWIGLVNEEPDKITALRLAWEAAGNNHFQIWTSVYTYMEFTKGVLPSGEAYNSEEHDATVENLLSQAYVRRVQFDLVIARKARALKRDYHKEGLKKRADAIHLATALFYNAEQMHTYDQSHLLPFDERLFCRNGKPLKITKPDPLYFGETLFTKAAVDGEADEEDTVE